MLATPLLVGLGAILGALSRYFITMLCAQKWGTGFPYGTFLINLSGSVLIGFLAVGLDRVASVSLNLLILTGFLGSYTTFSTYELDVFSLLRSGNSTRALLYGLGSPALGLIGVEIGIYLAKLMWQS